MLTRHHIIPALLALALLGGPAAAMAQTPAKTYTRTIDKNEAVTPSTHVTVENLVGHVKVSQGGKQLVIHADVVAGGADMAAAKALADSIRLEVQNDTGRILVHVHYPVDTYDRYQYNPNRQEECGLHILGVTIGGCYGNFSLTYQGHDVRVYRGRSEGTPLHVDLTLKLPAGTAAKVVNHVGLVQAKGLKNSLAFDTDSGDVAAADIQGDLRIKSGSGDIHVTDHHGTATVHTGSGDVTTQRMTGDLDLHTGSGDVNGQDLHGGTLALDTGSGDIHIDGISGSLQLHVGSGDIKLKGLDTVASLRADSGSGDIHLYGNLSGLQSFDLQTGSGDVTLASAQPPAVHLDIDSSDIEVDWPSLHDTRKNRRHFSGKIGAATGQGRISTGSGDVTLTQ